MEKVGFYWVEIEDENDSNNNIRGHVWAEGEEELRQDLVNYLADSQFIEEIEFKGADWSKMEKGGKVETVKDQLTYLKYEIEGDGHDVNVYWYNDGLDYGVYNIEIDASHYEDKISKEEMEEINKKFFKGEGDVFRSDATKGYKLSVDNHQMTIPKVSRAEKEKWFNSKDDEFRNDYKAEHAHEEIKDKDIIDYAFSEYFPSDGDYWEKLESEKMADGGETKRKNRRFGVFMTGNTMVGELAYAQDLNDLINNKMLKRWGHWGMILNTRMRMVKPFKSQDIITMTMECRGMKSNKII